MKTYIVSLGCARNLVDSEIMIGRLIVAGCIIVEEPEHAEIIIINSCSFIQSAAEESIQTILNLAQYKQIGSCEKLIVTGCLPERYREDIISALPEVDKFIGTGAFDQIVQVINEKKIKESIILPDPDRIKLHTSAAPRVKSSLSMAYIKIAEGCNKRCTYCVIPKLRGKQRSRPVKDILREAKNLINSGSKELILISQDSTAYGTDLSPAVRLDRLLDELSNIDNNIWIRFLYGHPESINKKIINSIIKHPNICKYFDIPIQHASNSVLKRMGRHYTRDDLYKLFDLIRNACSEACLRTTVITGFPGETDKDFESLTDFITDIKFDHLGAFIYSDADDLYSYSLPNKISESIAIKRQKKIMSLQAKISFKKNIGFVGKIYPVLVEQQQKKTVFIGRTQFQSPDVDGLTYINIEPSGIKKLNKKMIGSFVNIKINKAEEYDLTGTIDE